MKNYTDKELAGFMLEMRQSGGKSGKRYFKRNKWRFLLLFSLAVLLFVLGITAQAWWLCGFVPGLVFGMFSRDRVWLRGQQAAWPFYDKVIEWSKVETIANGDSSA